MDGQHLWAWIDRGQVRVELPFDVDFVKLAERLREAGYFYAHHPERVDAQGWGPQRDYEGYYPYWVWREGGAAKGQPTRTFFGCPPEDYTAPQPPRSRGLSSARRRRPGRNEARTDVEAAAELAPPAEPVIGPAALAEIRRWVPFLRKASH